MQDLVNRQCALWHLEPLGPALETRTSIIQKVQHAAGLAALKCLRPGNEERRAPGIIAWFGGEGCVRLLRRDGDAVLLEWIDGIALSELVRNGRDVEAAEILAEVAGKLHSPRRQPGPDTVPLSERMAPLLSQHGAADVLTREAAVLGRRLLETARGEQPLHGDLHHCNILHHAQRGWLAIDPKGVFGDPHYDLANALCNPMQYPEVVRNQDRVVTLARVFADRLGLDMDRLLSYAFCHACLAALWSKQDGDDPTHWQEMARIFRYQRAHER